MKNRSIVQKEHWTEHQETRFLFYSVKINIVTLGQKTNNHLTSSGLKMLHLYKASHLS